MRTPTKVVVRVQEAPGEVPSYTLPIGEYDGTYDAILDPAPVPMTAFERETERLLAGYDGDETYPDDDESLDWDEDTDGPG